MNEITQESSVVAKKVSTSQIHVSEQINQALLVCGSSVPKIFENEACIQMFAEILPCVKSIIVYRSSPS